MITLAISRHLIYLISRYLEIEYRALKAIENRELMRARTHKPKTICRQGRRTGLVNRPDFTKPMCKRLAKSDGAMFNEKKHLERIITSLRDVGE